MLRRVRTVPRGRNDGLHGGLGKRDKRELHGCHLLVNALGAQRQKNKKEKKVRGGHGRRGSPQRGTRMSLKPNAFLPRPGALDKGGNPHTNLSQGINEGGRFKEGFRIRNRLPTSSSTNVGIGRGKARC